MRKKQILYLVIVLDLILLVGLAALFILECWTPYSDSRITMPEDGIISLYQMEDGSVTIAWPECEEADFYMLEIVVPLETEAGEAQEQVLYKTYVAGQTSYQVEALPADDECTIRINAVVMQTIPFTKVTQACFGTHALEVTDCFRSPSITDVVWSLDWNTMEVDVSLETSIPCVTRMYHTNAAGQSSVQTLEQNDVVLTFGEGKQWQVPDYGDRYSYSFDSYVAGDGYVFYGCNVDAFSLTRADLLGTMMYVNCTSLENNAFSLTWNEVKGDAYEVQCWDDVLGEWITVQTIDKNTERSYTTECLAAYSTQRYRVIAEGEEGLVASDPVELQAGSAVVYSTVWPIQELKVYSNARKTLSIGSIEAGTALCVLELDNGMFKVRYGEGYGYIDSNYCMINVSEFLGELCLYNITNSYDSLYAVHDLPIDAVTGEVTLGYEDVLLNDGSYLVPLLYPTAIKLEQAALAAKEMGYSLKIYDSFRPQAATYELYNLASVFINNYIPLSALQQLGISGTANPENPALSNTTYSALMTDNGRYVLSYFLARSISRHNQGLAMDLTLVKDGTELKMQTAMHDLSWYSETRQNTESASMLAQIMKSCGFAGLSSEWWHFQDDEAKDNLNPAALWDGVSPECWMADEYGWRYRTADGNYLTHCTATIDGVAYTFDRDGYLIE